MTTKRQLLNSGRSRSSRSAVQQHVPHQQVRVAQQGFQAPGATVRTVSSGHHNPVQVKETGNGGGGLIVRTIPGNRPVSDLPGAHPPSSSPTQLQTKVRSAQEQPSSATNIRTSEAPQADVTVLLTSFERPQFFRTQVDALFAQSVQPAQIMVWQNPGAVPPDERTLAGLGALVLRANMNLGPWFRFTLALEMPTQYVCILDDDTIPGPQWLEAAMSRLVKSIEEDKPVCVASAGKVFRSDDPNDFITVGPSYPQPEEKEVDIGQNGWIFHKELLWMFAANPVLGDRRLGWDLHLAASFQREGIPTVVLPYSPGDRAAWGMVQQPDSEMSISRKLDAMAEAGGQTSQFIREQLYRAYRDSGWMPQVVRDSAESTQAPAKTAAEDVSGTSEAG